MGNVLTRVLVFVSEQFKLPKINFNEYFNQPLIKQKYNPAAVEH